MGVSAMTDKSRRTTEVRSFQIVRCLRCGHVWDDLSFYEDEENPGDEVCACISKYGQRTVEVLSEGTTNTPRSVVLP